MPRHQYRSEMGILGDILDVASQGGREGAIVSSIARKANLSHYVAVVKCQKLIAAGLVENVRSKRNSAFLVTPKGLEFFAELRRFQGIAESVNLRC